MQTPATSSLTLVKNDMYDRMVFPPHGGEVKVNTAAPGQFRRHKLSQEVVVEGDRVYRTAGDEII